MLEQLTILPYDESGRGGIETEQSKVHLSVRGHLRKPGCSLLRCFHQTAEAGFRGVGLFYLKLQGSMRNFSVRKKKGGNQSSSFVVSATNGCTRQTRDILLICARISKSKSSGFACAMQPCSVRFISNQIRTTGVQQYSRSIQTRDYYPLLFYIGHRESTACLKITD